MSSKDIRIGVDFGGTKVEAAALDRDGRFLARVRKPNPGEYKAAVETVKSLVEEAEQQIGSSVDKVGVGMPGSISPVTHEVRNSNSTWLNGTPFDKDLAKALGKTVRVANDANCFALSEAIDGAGKDGTVVFGVIIGTGCGGGVVSHKKALDGKNFIAGEWGHTPLPWMQPDEFRSQTCWCGRFDCLERYVAGSAFVNHYKAAGGDAKDGAEIVARARAGEALAEDQLERYINRLGRALAMVCDILDPDVIVLGGGMSNTDELYGERLRKAVEKPIFSDQFITPIRRPEHGDSSGVRGAAWLWPWD